MIGRIKDMAVRFGFERTFPQGLLSVALKPFSWLSPESKKSRMITKREVAQLFGVSTYTIDLWLNNGKLPKATKIFFLRRWEYEQIAALRKSRRASAQYSWRPTRFGTVDS
jgi:predicted DNA-binding transcriptional regulator AlpA